MNESDAKGPLGPRSALITTPRLSAQQPAAVVVVLTAPKYGVVRRLAFYPHTRCEPIGVSYVFGRCHIATPIRDVNVDDFGGGDNGPHLIVVRLEGGRRQSMGRMGRVG